jgi:hypothetical protein
LTEEQILCSISLGGSLLAADRIKLLPKALDDCSILVLLADVSFCVLFLEFERA